MFLANSLYYITFLNTQTHTHTKHIEKTIVYLQSYALLDLESFRWMENFVTTPKFVLKYNVQSICKISKSFELSVKKYTPCEVNMSHVTISPTTTGRLGPVLITVLACRTPSKNQSTHRQMALH